MPPVVPARPPGLAPSGDGRNRPLPKSSNRAASCAGAEPVRAATGEHTPGTSSAKSANGSSPVCSSRNSDVVAVNGSMHTPTITGGANDVLAGAIFQSYVCDNAPGRPYTSMRCGAAAPASTSAHEWPPVGFTPENGAETGRLKTGAVAGSVAPPRTSYPPCCDGSVATLKSSGNVAGSSAAVANMHASEPLVRPEASATSLLPALTLAATCVMTSKPRSCAVA